MAASVEGKLTNGYLAPNTFIHKRDILKKVFPRYREDTLFDFMLQTNRKVETDNTLFNWHEWDYLYGYATVESHTSSGGAGNSIDVTITDASHTEGGTKSAGKVGDSVMINGIRGWVTAKDDSVNNAHVYTVKPVRSTDDYGALTTQDGQILVFYSNAKSDGSGQPESQVRKPTRYYNYTQIFATKFEAYGSESANKVEFEINGKPYFYLQGVTDAALKHKTDMDYAFLLNVMGNELTDANNGDEPVYHTRGMESYLDDFGNTEPYTIGSFGWTDMANIAKTLSAERAPLENAFIVGIDLDIELDDLIKSKLDNTAVNYSAFGSGNAKQRAIDLGFDSFRYGTRTFHKQQSDAFNYLPVTGWTDSPYPHMGFIVPLDMTRDPKTGKDMYKMALRYKRNDKDNRYIKHWTRDITITNNDILEFNHLSEAGLMMACLNQAVKVAGS